MIESSSVAALDLLRTTVESPAAVHGLGGCRLFSSPRSDRWACWRKADGLRISWLPALRKRAGATSGLRGFVPATVREVVVIFFMTRLLDDSDNNKRNGPGGG
jgi:hypothetical protein